MMSTNFVLFFLLICLGQTYARHCIHDFSCPADQKCINSACACRDLFYDDPNVNQPEPRCLNRIKLNSSCTHDYQCGINAHCFNSKCTCKSGNLNEGNLNYGSTETNCYPKTCHSAHDCASWPNAECNHDKKECKCGQEYFWNSTQESCSHMYAPIGVYYNPFEPTKAILNCAPNAIIAHKLRIGDFIKCICEVGFETLDGFHCTEMNCKEDGNCTKLMKNTRCDEKGHCNCKPSYDGFWGQCDLKYDLKHLVNESCSADFYCGEHAKCHYATDKKCHCDLGFKQAENVLDCELIKCTKSEDCNVDIYSNLICNTTTNVCFGKTNGLYGLGKGTNWTVLFGLILIIAIF